MQRLSSPLHGTLGCYLRDPLHEGSANAVACLHVPRALIFSPFVIFALWSQIPFLVKLFCLRGIEGESYLEICNATRT
jgi:ABC-type transport system involved in cytochrome c biogenesis permease subunit